MHDRGLGGCASPHPDPLPEGEGRVRSLNKSASRSSPASALKCERTRSRPAAASLRAGCGIAGEGIQRLRQSRRIAGIDQHAGFALVDQFGDGGHRVAATGRPLLCASISTLGSPSRSPSPAMRLASTNRSARDQVGEHLVLRLGAAPVDAVGEPEPLGLGLQRPSERAAADMLEAPVQVRRAAAPARRAARRSPSSRPRARPKQDHDRVGRIAAVARRARRGRRREAAEVEPVIDQLDGSGRGASAAQMVVAHRACR